jgi:hypothetical protein
LIQAINEQAILSLPSSTIGVLTMTTKREWEHDVQADVQALQDAHKNHLFNVIRSSLNVLDYLDQIAEAATMDNNILNLQKQLFAGGLGVSLAMAQQKFAQDYLDKLAERKAQLVVDGKEQAPWEFSDL